MVRPLGRGGMGEVYIARTRRPDRPVVAVKRLRGDVARVPTFAERFEHESQLAVRLAHPNVVATIDVGTVGAQLYVASELVLGKDTGVIADRLRERGQGAPVAVVVRVLLDVLQGLAYVHSARERDGRWLALVHRDVTPGNVLVSYEGVARMADFGLAKSQLTDKSNLTSHGEILGTPHYMAPELVRGAKASPSSDLYGLGAVTYRILTGLAPFTGSTTEVLMKVLNERPRPLIDWRPDLPPWFAAIVHELLDPDPKRRPFDAGLLARRLEHEAEGARLLLPHASVGRWLSQLFEEEKSREIEEYEAISAMSPTVPDPDDDTRILAALEAGRGLEGGSSLAQSDDVGTELELSSAMFADLSREARRGRTASGQLNDTGPLDPAERRLPEWRDTVNAPDGTPRTPVPPTTDRDENEATRENADASPSDPDDRTTEDPSSLLRVLPGFADRNKQRPVIAAIDQVSGTNEEIATAVTDMELRKILESADPDDRTAVRAPAAAPTKLRVRNDDSRTGRMVDDPASRDSLRVDRRVVDDGKTPVWMPGADLRAEVRATDRAPRPEIRGNDDRSTLRGEDKPIVRLDEPRPLRLDDRAAAAAAAALRADERSAARTDERAPIRLDPPRVTEGPRPEDQRALRTEDVRIGRVVEDARAADPASRTPRPPPNTDPPIEATRPLTRRPATGQPSSSWSPKRFVLSLAAVALTAAATTAVVLALANGPTAAEQAANSRFTVLRQQVTVAAEKGEPIDAHAVALLAEAAQALVAHDVPRAEVALDQLEATLAAPRVPKNP